MPTFAWKYEYLTNKINIDTTFCNSIVCVTISEKRKAIQVMIRMPFPNYHIFILLQHII